MLRYSLSILFFSALLSASFADYNSTIYTFKTLGSLNIKAIVYYPNITTSDKHPVFYGVHGGGYVTGSKIDAFSFQEIDEALSRGWVVVAIDYRLSPAALIEDIVADMQDGYNWIRTELASLIPIDPDLITVFGGSAGGGMAIMAGFKLTPRPKAVISFYPYCTNFTDPYAYKPATPVSKIIVAEANNLKEVITEYETTDLTDSRLVLFFSALADGKGGWLLTTHDPNFSTDQIMAKLRSYSATENVDANFPPTYLAHGLVDQLVPYSQSVQMANVLKAKNIPYVLDLVPGANHAFDLTNPTPEMWKDHVLPAFDFAQKYMTKSTKKIKFLSH
jgi:acetyl esterase/lipase